MRSMRRDDVGDRAEAAQGHARGRSPRFARPYRRDLAVFLLTVVVVVGDRRGHPAARRRRGQRDHPHGAGAGAPWSRIAVLIAGLAVVDALLSLGQRWYSARIGEGIIFDLRTQVYDHVQRMPLQFFTRTQTGALVSRLNNDVHRRPAGVHLDAVRRRRQRHRAGPHRRRDVHPVLADHRAVAGAAAGRSSCRPGGSAAGWPAITRESYQLDATMNATMTERFGVAGALLVKLFGRPDDGGRARSPAGPAGSATSACSRPCTAGRSSSRCCLVAVAGPGAHLRARRLARGHRARIDAGTVVTPGAAADPAVRAAHRAVQRAGRRDERAGLVRAGLRGARPRAGDRREAGRRSTLPGGTGHDRVPRRAVPLPDAPPRCRSPRWRTWPCSTAPSPSRCCAACRFTVAAGPAGRAGRARPAPASRPSPCWCRGSTTCTAGAVRVGGVDVRDVTLRLAARHDRRRHPGRAPVPRDDRGEPALRPAGRDRRRAVAGAGRGPDRRPGRAACPTGSTPWSASAATGSPAARSSGIAIARLLLKAPGDRDPRRGDRAPGLRVRGGRAAGAGRRAGRAGPRWSSRTGCPPCATPTRSSCSTAAGSSSAGTHERAARRRRALRRALPHPVPAPGRTGRHAGQRRGHHAGHQVGIMPPSTVTIAPVT